MQGDKNVLNEFIMFLELSKCILEKHLVFEIRLKLNLSLEIGIVSRIFLYIQN